MSAHSRTRTHAQWQAVSYSVVVVLITSFHCEHISVVLNLGSCLLIQRVELCKCASVCTCVYHKLHSSEANSRHSQSYHLCLFEQTNALIYKNFCRYSLYMFLCFPAQLLHICVCAVPSNRRKTALPRRRWDLKRISRHFKRNCFDNSILFLSWGGFVKWIVSNHMREWWKQGKTAKCCLKSKTTPTRT